MSTRDPRKELRQQELTAESVEPVASGAGAAAIAALGLEGVNYGCGPVLHEICLNVDVARFATRSGDKTVPGALARVDGCVYLEHDATSPLPAAEASFAWAFSEHFIEHVPPGAAIAWLRDVRRVLKPEGHVRISTPDLRKYASAYLGADSFFEEHRDRLRPMLEPFLKPVDPVARPGAIQNAYLTSERDVPARPAFMLNQIFMLPLWGHKWLYDLDELRYAAVSAGFSADAVIEVSFGKGRSPEVAALDAPVHDDESLYVEIVRE
jgi:SAM-dependent methyltransferase